MLIIASVKDYEFFNEHFSVFINVLFYSILYIYFGHWLDAVFHVHFGLLFGASQCYRLHLATAELSELPSMHVVLL